MNFSEFKMRKGAEPMAEDPEVIAARKADPEFDAFATEAEAFEARLHNAAHAPQPGEDLLEAVLNIPAEEQSAPPRRRWFAMAASVLVLLSAGVLTWQMNQPPESLEEYLLSHYRHDGASVLSHADGDFDREELQGMLARLDVKAGPQLASQVSYIKFCPTAHGRGAHMVFNTTNGPVTVIFMPQAELDGPVNLEFDGLDANVFALQTGAAAIIAPHGQTNRALASLLENGLTPLTSGI